MLGCSGEGWLLVGVVAGWGTMGWLVVVGELKVTSTRVQRPDRAV